MFNLIKYELKGYFKDFIIILGIIALINILLYTRMNTWPRGAIVSLSFLVSFAAAIVVLIWNIKLFSRDMYEDSGYLLFTLPQTGYSILGSKLITSIIQVLIVGAVALIFNFISLQSIDNFRNNAQIVFSNINPNLAPISIISSLINYVFFLTTIYFSISLSKIAIRKRKFGKLGAFVIFVIFSLIVGKITMSISNTFPQSFKLNLLSAQSQISLYGPSNISINIAATIFSVMLFILMFIATSYIIENRIDF
ncbi:hypothetical protein [Clostridium thailandense]|uniref:Uncharacterized protein n=1 Tax=Clostridium thailandense TaxID=2794346 RepID=A0A949U0V9_9CLOT|nr:hypothetical protein [Clostridium thailandense]MBV7274393.1 hypothetical protein [Clostridium thailandense]